MLILLVSRKAQERSAHERSVTQLVQLFSASGVDLPASLVPIERPRLSAVEPARSTDDEALFAEALLGTCTAEDVGGGIYRYVSDAGQCLFRSSGMVEATLERDVDDPGSFCKNLFAAYGYTLLSSSLSNGSGTVSALRTPQDATIFNAELTLTFENDRLSSVEGFFVPTFESAGYGSGIDGITALVRFLDYSTGSGEVCTQIRDVRCGYLLQSTTSASQRLIPAWCITTDVNEYYVNSSTGEVSREA